MNDDRKAVPEELEPLQDDLAGVVIDNFQGLIDRPPAMLLAQDIIEWLTDNGWLVELPRCSKTEWETNAHACDNLVARPGDEFCSTHQEV